MKSTFALFLMLIATASAGVSRSDVHFNMGGSRIAYSINHRPNPHGGPNAFVSVSRTEPVRHHPVHDSAHKTPIHVPVHDPVPAHHIHDSAQQTPIHVPVHDAVPTHHIHDSTQQTPSHVPVHDAVPAHHVHDSAQQTPIHIPVHVAAPAHHVAAPIHPAAAFHTSLVYDEPFLQSLLPTMRHAKHHLDSYYPYTYAPYYPHAGHPSFILVA